MPASSTPPRPRADLDDEEAAAYAGLRDFLHSLAADHTRIRRRHGRVAVRLSYAA